MSKSSLQSNFEAYIAAFDGIPKDFAEVSHFVDAVYHENFAYTANGNPVDRAIIKQYQANFFAMGSKATLVYFKEVGPDTVEFKFRLVNEKIDTVFHNIAQVKDDKVFTFNPIDQVAEENVKKVREVSNVETVKQEG